MKIYLIAPKNPESFWTFDRILPSLGKRCVFPNLALPTVAALTPRAHEVVLCDENVEPIDFDTDADIVGDHRLRHPQAAHARDRRGLPAARQARGRRRPVRLALSRGAARPRRRASSSTRPSTRGRSSSRDYEAGSWQSEYRQDEKPSMLDSPLPRFDLLKVDRYRSMTIQFARGCPFNCEFCDIIVMYGRRPRTKSVAQVMAEVDADPRPRHREHLRRRRQLHRQQEGREGAAARDRRVAGGPRLSDRVHDRGDPERRAGRRAPPPAEATRTSRRSSSASSPRGRRASRRPRRRRTCAATS